MGSVSQPGRLSGVLLPLFSLRSKDDFGVGDFAAIDGLLAWMQRANQKLLMMLPLLPTAPGDTSPYSTRSAFGLAPLFIHPGWLPEGVELTAEEKEALERARAAPSVRYPEVFRLKNVVLARAFARYEATEGRKVGDRERQFRAWQEEQAEWLRDFTLFCALHEEHGSTPWWEWPAPLAKRDPRALEEARQRQGVRLRWYAWLQWVAHLQWGRVREQARARGVLLCGDEPFIIAQDSADCWAYPGFLRCDARLGVPPDDFSADGQDWGLPWFDFEALAKDGDAWIRRRAKAAAETYDVRRVDHAIGYFRQYLRDAKTPRGRFVPDDAAAWERLGEKYFRLLSEGTGIFAEDLGVIPKFARKVLDALGLPGYQVMRWAREESVYRDPHAYPELSLVTTGTHDTDTLRVWWETAAPWERETVCRTFPELKGFKPDPAFRPEVHEALVSAMMNARSRYAVIPWQDIFGERDRVNLPGTMGEHNWSYRMGPPVEELLVREDTVAAADWLAGLTVTGQRA